MKRKITLKTTSKALLTKQCDIIFCFRFDSVASAFLCEFINNISAERHKKQVSIANFALQNI